MSRLQSNMTRHARRSAKEARRAARDLRHSADESAATMRDTVRKVGSEVVGAFRDGVESLRDTTNGYVKQGRDTAQAWEESMEERIQERPVASVLMGVGLGFLLGFFFSRR